MIGRPEELIVTKFKHSTGNQIYRYILESYNSLLPEVAHSADDQQVT